MQQTATKRTGLEGLSSAGGLEPFSSVFSRTVRMSIRDRVLAGFPREAVADFPTQGCPREVHRSLLSRAEARNVTKPISQERSLSDRLLQTFPITRPNLK